jgi:predicted transcriptional regulator
MTKKLAAQKTFIEGICDRLGMDYQQLAEVAGINPETMRKYAHGYQKMGDTAGLLLQHIEKEHLHDKSRMKHLTRVDETLASAFAYMDSATLDDNFKGIAAKLPGTSGAGRRDILGNLRAMLDELDVRHALKRNEAGLKAANSTPLSSAAKLARRAAGVRD